MDVLQAVAAAWATEPDPRVEAVAARLRAALDARRGAPPPPPWTDPRGQRVAPPPGLREAATSGGGPILDAVARTVDALPWKEPRSLSPSYSASVGPGQLRSAMLLGDPSHGASPRG